MLDTIAENKPDRRPVILACIYEADDLLWAGMDADGASALSTAGAQVRSLAPEEPAALAGLISSQLADADCRAVLIIGRTRKSTGFRIQMRAENRALVGGGKISQIGPALARATAPAAEMVRALIDVGLAADATSESEEDAGSYLLYRVLTALPDNLDAPAVGLLRAPISLHGDQLRLGLQTATAAMARHLSPLPRARPS